MVTVGRDTKLAACLAPPFSASHGWVVDRRIPRFADQVLAAAPKGVSVILDCVGTSYWGQNGQSIAVDGRWVLYATMGGATFTAGDALSDLFRKRVRLQATTLRTRTIDYKIDLMQRVATLLPKFASGELHLPIARVFPLAQVSQAHLMMEADGMCRGVTDGGSCCRIVLCVADVTDARAFFLYFRRQHGQNFAGVGGRMTNFWRHNQCATSCCAMHHQWFNVSNFVLIICTLGLCWHVPTAGGSQCFACESE